MKKIFEKIKSGKLFSLIRVGKNPALAIAAITGIFVLVSLPLTQADVRVPAGGTIVSFEQLDEYETEVPFGTTEEELELPAEILANFSEIFYEENEPAVLSIFNTALRVIPRAFGYCPICINSAWEVHP